MKLFVGGQIRFGSKPAIQRDFQRVAPINLPLPIEHGESQIAIGRIALGDHTVGDQVGGTHTQTGLVPIVGVPAVLDDDVDVRFENRYVLLRRRELLALEHPAFGLVDHLAGQIDITVQFGTEPNSLKPGMRFASRIAALAYPTVLPASLSKSR